MAKYIIAGADVHEKNILVIWAADKGPTRKFSVSNSETGRDKMVSRLKEAARKAKAEQVAYSYEASYCGFGLYDQLSEAGIECSVLAPTKIARSPSHVRGKTDEKDAMNIFEILRAHLLAGNQLPAVWVPDHKTRQDRKLVRRRLGLGERRTALKNKIRMLLKQVEVTRPDSVGKAWSVSYLEWLDRLRATDGPLPYACRAVLDSCVRELQWVETEIERQMEELKLLSKEARYALPAEALMAMKGVGLLTAMVFLTEMGDLSRFSNRRQVGAYLGLTPSSHESGEGVERKGHITKQGPARLRWVLCQAAWAHIGSGSKDDRAYERIVARNPKKKKIATVALMRRLAIRMWHLGLAAQRREESYERQLAGSTA